MSSLSVELSSLRGRALAGCALAIGLGVSGGAGSAAAQDTWSTPHPGVRYLYRRTAAPIRAHALVVDLCEPGIALRATREDERRRTPSSFGALVGAQASINGDFFNPTTLRPLGLAVGAGAPWSGTADPTNHGYLAFGPRRAHLSVPTLAEPRQAWMREVVGGVPDIVAGGRPIYGHIGPCARNPHTAVGFSADHRTMIWVVVDGRSTSSRGMTCDELADFLVELGAHEALNLDGGGSSAMWVAGRGVVNAPSDGSERVVTNHLALIASGRGPPDSCPREPLPPSQAVLRHIPNPTVFLRWFAPTDTVELSAAELASYRRGPAWPAGPPELIQGEGQPGVHLKLGDVRRHVPSPRAMNAWRFEWAAIRAVPVATVDAQLAGPALPEIPFVASAAGDPGIYVIDRRPALWADPTSVTFPATVVEGATSEVRARLRNEGSLTWRADEIQLRVTPRGRASELCDPSWPSCDVPWAIDASTAPGASREARFLVLGPAGRAGDTIRLCVGLAHTRSGLGRVHWFSDAEQGGPADDALCGDVRVEARCAPAGETCDGTDQDCDGRIDEGACDAGAATPDAGASARDAGARPRDAAAGFDAAGLDAGGFARDGGPGASDAARADAELVGGCACRLGAGAVSAPGPLALFGLGLLVCASRRRRASAAGASRR